MSLRNVQVEERQENLGPSFPPLKRNCPTIACARTTVGVDYGKIRMHNICPVHVAGQMFAAVILKAQD